MKKRACERTPADIKVRFYCCKEVFSGTIVNLSEKDMLIKTKKMCFPFDSEFEVFIPLKKDILHVPVKLNRIEKSTDSHDLIAIELLKPPKKYLEFVAGLRPS